MLRMVADTALVYHFDIRAESKIHKTTIIVKNDEVVTSCTCKTSEGRKTCWHAKYILAGRSRRLSQSGTGVQQTELLSTLSRTQSGKQLLKDAQSSFVNEESCRRCSSSSVIVLKKSLWGRVVGLLKPNSHSYYCKSCGWSW
jgi:hypothetical protein